MSDLEQTPLDPGYSIDAFDSADAEAVEDVLALWRQERAVTGAEAQRRVHEVLLVARTVDGGQVVGVTTTPLHHSTRLGMDLWYLRVFVAEAHRQSNLAVHLAVRGRDLLQERFVSGEDRRGAGLITDVQSDALVRSQPEAVWRRTKLTYIGDNPRGEQVRVRYFPGALAPPPPTTTGYPSA